MNRPIEAAAFNGDPLVWLTRKPLQQFPRRRIIYDSRLHADSLFVVVSGRVKVTQTAADGSQTVVRIVAPGGIFGEIVLAAHGARSEAAVALDAVKLVAWSTYEIERQIEQEPVMGIALVQYMVRQCLALEERIHCMALCKTPERVALALVQLAEALGSRSEDGAMRMAALTHQTLADYIGTSREIVTFQLNRLRKLGMVKYSRRHIDVYTAALLESLGKTAAGLTGPPGKRKSAVG